MLTDNVSKTAVENMLPRNILSNSQAVLKVLSTHTFKPNLQLSLILKGLTQKNIVINETAYGLAKKG